MGRYNLTDGALGGADHLRSCLHRGRRGSPDLFFDLARRGELVGARFVTAKELRQSFVPTDEAADSKLQKLLPAKTGLTPVQKPRDRKRSSGKP